MSLVDTDKLTELRTAAQSKETATTALDDVQIKEIAYAINTAANTGELRVEFVHRLREATKAQLLAKGYKITETGTAVQGDIVVISWK